MSSSMLAAALSSTPLTRGMDGEAGRRQRARRGGSINDRLGVAWVRVAQSSLQPHNTHQLPSAPVVKVGGRGGGGCEVKHACRARGSMKKQACVCMVAYGGPTSAQKGGKCRGWESATGKRQNTGLLGGQAPAACCCRLGSSPRLASVGPRQVGEGQGGARGLVSPAGVVASALHCSAQGQSQSLKMSVAEWEACGESIGG